MEPSDPFWKRWITQYLLLTQERSKWNPPSRNISTGDLVVIVEDTAPRNMRLLRLKVKTLPDARYFVQSVLVKTKTSVLQRPISKLCLLIEAAN